MRHVVISIRFKFSWDSDFSLLTGYLDALFFEVNDFLLSGYFRIALIKLGICCMFTKSFR